MKIKPPGSYRGLFLWSMPVSFQVPNILAHAYATSRILIVYIRQLEELEWHRAF
jgi:hypothetical protein